MMTDDEFAAKVDSLSVAVRDLVPEIRRLHAIEAWALSTRPFKVGDRVVIADHFTVGLSGGWWVHREHLRPGGTGTVKGIEFVAARTREIPQGFGPPVVERIPARWIYMFEPEVEWTLHEPVASGGLPRVYVHEGDAKHVFMLDEGDLRLAADADTGLTVPTDGRDVTTSTRS